MNTFRTLLGILAGSSLLVAVGCGAPGTQSALEDARFALDAADYATAVTKATEAYAANPTDLPTALVLSSAYAGRGGISTLDMAESLSETGATSDAFDRVHDIFVSTLTSTGLADLRLAIATLTDFAGTISSDQQGSYSYQLGVLQMIEALALPTLTAQPAAGGTVTATAITSAQKDFVQADFVGADNNLIAAGLASDNALVTLMRQNYCALADVSGTAGFTLAELQDLTLCELNDNLATLTQAAGSFQSPAILTCLSFDFSCTAVDTTD
ncbi:MAG: hypothetical protein HY696_05805 [Deltaproteobacteria bacterium]|nr:hypothetical protein [Deltaproteobacteria bacterium]